MTDLTITLDTTQGRPADLLEALAADGITITAGCLFPRLEGRVAHVTIDDEHVAKARKIVTALGATLLDEREVLVVDAPGPGGAPAMARAIADAGASVYIAYFGARGEVVLGTSDLDIARRALGLS